MSEGVPPDSSAAAADPSGERGDMLHPRRVFVHSNAGAGHCLYFALEQASRRMGEAALGMRGQRRAIADWLSAHLDDSMTVSTSGPSASDPGGVGGHQTWRTMIATSTSTTGPRQGLVQLGKTPSLC